MAEEWVESLGRRLANYRDLKPDHSDVFKITQVIELLAAYRERDQLRAELEKWHGLQTAAESDGLGIWRIEAMEYDTGCDTGATDYYVYTEGNQLVADCGANEAFAAEIVRLHNLRSQLRADLSRLQGENEKIKAAVRDLHEDQHAPGHSSPADDGSELSFEECQDPLCEMVAALPPGTLTEEKK